QRGGRLAREGVGSRWLSASLPHGNAGPRCCCQGGSATMAWYFKTPSAAGPAPPSRRTGTPQTRSCRCTTRAACRLGSRSRSGGIHAVPLRIRLRVRHLLASIADRPAVAYGVVADHLHAVAFQGFVPQQDLYRLRFGFVARGLSTLSYCSAVKTG